MTDVEWPRWTMICMKPRRLPLYMVSSATDYCILKRCTVTHPHAATTPLCHTVSGAVRVGLLV